MVRQAGFEPTTPWFVARYSIQLSYWRTRRKRIIHGIVEIIKSRNHKYHKYGIGIGQADWLFSN